MAAPRVLVLTADLDPTADAVLAHLLKRGIPFTRLDPKTFLASGSMTARLGQDGAWEGVLRGGPRDIDLGELRAIWVRRPGEIAPPKGIDPADADWCVGQAREALWGVLQALPQVQWVNPLVPARAAARKPVHLAAGAACGLSVPATLLTNIKADLEPFARSCNRRVVTKTLYPRSPRDAAGELAGVLYTQRVPPERWRDPSIAATVHQFQAEVAPARRLYDLRVVCVGERLFPVEIHATTEKAALDYRADYSGQRLQPGRLPDTVSEGVHRLMAHLGLVFAVLDFIVTDDDALLVDLGPSAQWLWLETQGGQPISEAIADLLTRERR